MAWTYSDGPITFDDISLSAITAPIPTKTGYSLPQFSNAQRELWVASALERYIPMQLNHRRWEMTSA